ncbi:SgcJ/EcaC family oxidoreductase [soil metagenome]
MNRREILGGATAIGSAALLMPGLASANTPDESVAVRALLEEYCAAWAASDAARMFASATDNIHWVNVVGMHWQGKADVEHAHDVYLTTIFKGVPMTLEEVESIVPIGAETLAVVARFDVGGYTTPGGFTAPASKDRMSLILLKSPAGLRIAHVANIEIVAAAAAHNPIRRPPSA